MAQNTSPIFPFNPRVSWVTQSVANTALDGTGNVGNVFTAQSSGSRIDYLSMAATGSAPATVLRVWLNNGGVNSTAANNSLYTEYALPTTAASATAPAGPTITLPMNLSLPSGSRINLTLGTAVTPSAAWHITAFGGDY
jgi:hypothetical protein